eukprot:1196116-Prorocentrum_minimum.AAC.4
MRTEEQGPAGFRVASNRFGILTGVWTFQTSESLMQSSGKQTGYYKNETIPIGLFLEEIP